MSVVVSIIVFIVSADTKQLENVYEYILSDKLVASGHFMILHLLQRSCATHESSYTRHDAALATTSSNKNILLYLLLITDTMYIYSEFAENFPLRISGELSKKHERSYRVIRTNDCSTCLSIVEIPNINGKMLLWKRSPGLVGCGECRQGPCVAGKIFCRSPSLPNAKANEWGNMLFNGVGRSALVSVAAGCLSPTRSFPHSFCEPLFISSLGRLGVNLRRARVWDGCSACTPGCY